MAWQDMLRQGTGLLISGVFVVLITRVAVNERRLRDQKVALAEELGEANAKLRAYALQVEELSTLRERNRLAREIHDGLGHHLTATHVQLQAAQAVLQHDPDKAAVALEKARSLTQDALLDVRRSVGALRTSDRPLTEALNALTHEATAAGVPTEFTVTGTPRRLEPPIESSLFRVAQEGLTNVRKHARATHSAMKLRYEPATVELIVEDGGIGAMDASGGYGLLGIRERVAQLGGEVSITTSPQQGFILSARVPA
jgi:signal transduction histidine kinase